MYLLNTVKLVLSDRVWALKKWPLNTDGLCIEVKSIAKELLGPKRVVFKESLDTGGI